MNAIKNASQMVMGWFGGELANQNRISLLDVKALYDAAFEEKARAEEAMKAYQVFLVQAEALDTAYRMQLQSAQVQLHGKAA